MDKRAGLRGASRLCARSCAAAQFDVLLHMQLAFAPASSPARCRATIKLGFDRARARELQWLFTNARIAPRSREHVLDSFFGFLAALGIKERAVALGHAAARGCARLRRSG